MRQSSRICTAKERERARGRERTGGALVGGAHGGHMERTMEGTDAGRRVGVCAGTLSTPGRIVFEDEFKWPRTGPFKHRFVG